MNHLEIEFKTGLTQDEFQQLLLKFSSTKAIKQTNYYIDTKDFALRDQHMALRIRTFDDRGELTLKIPQKIGNMEYNQDLTLSQSQALLKNFQLPHGPIRKQLEETAIPLELLGILGSLSTIRREMRLDIGLLALDQNSYFGETDYELEIEVEEASQGKADFLQFLKENRIIYKKLKSKIARFAQKLANS